MYKELSKEMSLYNPSFKWAKGSPKRIQMTKNKLHEEMFNIIYSLRKYKLKPQQIQIPIRMAEL